MGEKTDMNLPSIFNILSAYNGIILLIIILSLIPDLIKRKRISIAFFQITLCVVLFIISDLGFNHTVNNPGKNTNILLKTDTFIYYFVQPFLFYFFIKYLNEYINPKEHKKCFWYTCRVLVALYMVFMIATPFTGFYYVIDDNNVYYRGTLHFISVVLDGFFLLMGLLYLLSTKKYITSMNKMPFYLFFIIPSVSEIIQLFFPEITIIASGISIPIIIIFLNLHKNLEKTLKFTDLYAKNMQSEMITLQNKTILSLSNLVENRGLDNGNHVIRITQYVTAIATRAIENGIYPETITPKYINQLKQAVQMHDIGKIVVPDAILNKHGTLTVEEFQQMKQHVTEGEKIVKMILGYEDDFRLVKMAQNVTKYHHEKWNGSGYPSGLSGHDIPLSARIMAIADVFDALVSNRIYKNSTMTIDKAFEIIEGNSGIAFDSELVALFMEVRNEIVEIIKNDGVIQ